MKTNSTLRGIYGAAAALVGVLFYFVIIGVFGLQSAIAGLAVFIFGAVVVFCAFPTESAKS